MRSRGWFRLGPRRQVPALGLVLLLVTPLGAAEALPTAASGTASGDLERHLTQWKAQEIQDTGRGWPRIGGVAADLTALAQAYAQSPAARDAFMQSQVEQDAGGGRIGSAVALSMLTGIAIGGIVGSFQPRDGGDNGGYGSASPVAVGVLVGGGMGALMGGIVGWSLGGTQVRAGQALRRDAAQKFNQALLAKLGLQMEAQPLPGGGAVEIHRAFGRGR